MISQILFFHQSESGYIAVRKGNIFTNASFIYQGYLIVFLSFKLQKPAFFFSMFLHALRSSVVFLFKEPYLYASSIYFQYFFHVFPLVREARNFMLSAQFSPLTEPFVKYIFLDLSDHR